jgi:signal transduction histidine kinase
MEDGSTTTGRPHRGLMDVLACSGAVILGADVVAIAVGKDSGWTVQGCSRPSAGLKLGSGVRTSDVDSLAAPTNLTWVALPNGGVKLLAADREGHQLSSGSVARHAMLGQPMDGWSVLVLMEGPKRSFDAESKRGMENLLHAAEDAVWAELEGDRQHLRAVVKEREEERRRWARELHDETLQQLGALQVLLTSARRSAVSGPSADVGRLLESVDVGVDLLAGQIASLRHLITELRPAALDELGLGAPLHALAVRSVALTGIRVSVEVSLRYADGEITTRLLPDIELALYRVVQEALTNAGRHSGAQRAWVSVLERDGEVTVEVGDDGAGMADGNRSGTGLGVRGMEERARLAGGRLEVLSANSAQLQGAAGQTSGTVVRMVVPATHRPPELRTGDASLE